MDSLVIQKLHEEFKETKKITIPDHLLPPEKGYILNGWGKELIRYYRAEGIVTRPFDDLPPIKLSIQPGLETTLLDVHKFIVSDMNLIPFEIRRAVIEHALSHESVQEAWKEISSIIGNQLKDMDNELVKEDLSWKFSPLVEILWAVVWFFMEREEVSPPRSIVMESDRFPYFIWRTEGKKQNLWEPENPFCRWEWLAIDLYNSWIDET